MSALERSGKNEREASPFRARRAISVVRLPVLRPSLWPVWRGFRP